MEPEEPELKLMRSSKFVHKGVKRPGYAAILQYLYRSPSMGVLK